MKINSLARPWQPQKPLPPGKFAEHLRRALGSPQQKVLARRTGFARSSVNRWLAGDVTEQFRFVLAALEHLPVAHGCSLIAPFLRVFPSLDHPLIRRLPNAGNLREIIQKAGPAMVVVTAANPYLRQFIVTAIGHTLEQAANGQPVVTGIDAATPDWFVPVPGMQYLHLDSPWSAASSSASWLNQLGTATEPWVILNGLSRRQTVLLVEKVGPDRCIIVGWREFGGLPPFPGQMQVVRVMGNSFRDLTLHFS